MKVIYLCFFATPVMLMLSASCGHREPTSTMITEPKAIELATKELAKTGRKAEGYRVKVENDTNGGKWVVHFELKAQFPPPGSYHIVSVEKKSGRAVFMPGE